jgi:Putative Flp pilus-assembly TadE/G-like
MRLGCLCRRGAGRARGDRGSLSTYVVLFAPIALALTGLAVDGGLALAARERAADIAEQAARRAADDVDREALREGRIVIRPDCWPRAEEITAAHGAGEVTGCSIDGNDATVAISLTYEPAILGLLGFGGFEAHAEATAEAVAGITAPGT